MRITTVLTGLLLTGLAGEASAQDAETASTPLDAPADDGAGEAVAPPPGFLAEILGLPGKFTSKGEVAFENRVFRDDKKPTTQDAGVGVMARVEWRHQHAAFEQKARVYGRLDALDKDRTVLVVEEGWVQAKRGRLRLRIGADIVNWTATEAFHPADVINARNLDSDLENLEKRGEPMAMLQVGILEGMTLQAFYMPVYMRSISSSLASRMSFVPDSFTLSPGHRRMNRDGHFTRDEFGHQGALRLSQTLGSADFSIHALEQLDRLEPLVGVRMDSGRLVLIEQTVRQVGGTYTQAFGGLLVKLEGAYRWFLNGDAPELTTLAAGIFVPGSMSRNHGTVALGFEYGFTHDGGSQSTLLLEGQAVVGAEKAVRETLNPFQRDVFVGYRFALNDEDDTQLMLGAIGDVENFDQLLGTVSYQQRLGETWSIRAGVRLFFVDEKPTPVGLAALEDADHVRLTLVHHF